MENFFNIFLRTFGFRSNFMVRIDIFKLEIIYVDMLLLIFSLLFLCRLKT